MAIYKYIGGTKNGEELVFVRMYHDLVCQQAKQLALQQRVGKNFDIRRKESSVIAENDEVYLFVGWDESRNGDVCYWVLVDDESVKFAILNTLAATSEARR